MMTSGNGASKPAGRELLGRSTKRQEVYIAAWDAAVLIRKLPADLALNVVGMAGEPVEGAEARAEQLKAITFAYVCAGWVNADGSPVLSPDDRALLLAEPLEALEQLAKAIRDFNGLGEQAAETAAKNSPPTLLAVSGSALP